MSLQTHPDPALQAQVDARITTMRGGARDRNERVAVGKGLRARRHRPGGAADFGEGGLSDNYPYWTSSQQTTDMANHIDFADSGRQHYDDKDFPRRVRAIRAF